MPAVETWRNANGGFCKWGSRIHKISKICFGPKLAPKGPLGLKMGPPGPKNRKESESGLKKSKNTKKLKKKKTIFKFLSFLRFLAVLEVLESSGRLKGTFPPIFVKNALHGAEL